MKKIAILFSFIFLTSSLNAQLNGLGTSSSPYNGTFQGDLQWNSTNFPSHKVYINGDVTIDNELLTIEAGMSIIFTSTGADLIITGTGQLNASGTNGNRITFTADFSPFNGVYGEAGERWGHIAFQNMTNTNPENYPSIINNCIIEYGQKNSSPFGNIDSYGGGIYAAFTYLTISNSIIRNNYAGWGGGIFVGASFSPAFKNSIISNNTAGTTGGGMLFYSNTASVVENCIIEKNTSAGNGGAGGVFLGDYAGDVRFYNCVIASNVSTLNYGHNILFYYNNPSTRPEFYNTIVWGTNTPQITYWSYSLSSSDFNYCAIVSNAVAYTSCIGLNSSNSASDGPNFVDPDNLDYSIRVISPCRDAGTSVNAPVTDFLGNIRVYNYDIGAYEVQYSRWLVNASTPASWTTSGNWEQGFEPGHNGTTGDVVIPALSNDTYAPNISGTVSVPSGKYIILEAGAKATFGTLSNSGTLKLITGDDPFSLIVNTYTRNSGGTEQIELYLTGKEQSGINKWHYISSPVSSLAASIFTVHTDNLAQFVENLPSGNAYQGWIAYDGYNYAGGADHPTFSSLNVGQGYNYFATLNYKYTFSGDLNTTNVSKTLAYTGAPNNPLRGFNLLGNPFSSGLNWDVIANGTYPSNTSKAIHFTLNDAQCDYVGGVGTNGATGIIPPMQGFFVKANNTPDIPLTLPASARVHNSIHSTYKGAAIIPLVRLSITENSITDETVVRFDESAKTDLDYDFDAVKMFVSATSTSIYSSMSGTNYAINGQPFPEFLEIPIVVNLLTSGNHTISTNQLQGLDNFEVTLTDKTTGFKTDLKATPSLAFSGSQGLIADRFILTVKGPTGIEDPAISKNTFNIYSSNNFINIQTLSDDWDGKTGFVNVLDLTGKTVSSHNNSEFSKNSLIQVSSPVTKGMYVVEIRSGAMRYVGKVVIR